MGKFASFLYKISTIVLITFAIIIFTIIATLVGLMISYGADALVKAITFLNSMFGNLLDDKLLQQVTDAITQGFKGVSWDVSKLDVAGKVLISIFSINVGIIGMFVVFGILSAHYRRKVAKEGKKAIKTKKRGNQDDQDDATSQYPQQYSQYPQQYPNGYSYPYGYQNGYQNPNSLALPPQQQKYYY